MLVHDERKEDMGKVLMASGKIKGQQKGIHEGSNAIAESIDDDENESFVSVFFVCVGLLGLD